MWNISTPTVIAVLIGFIIASGCNRESDANKTAATRPTATTAAPVDPPPSLSVVLEHFQRLMNDGANGAEAFAGRTRPLDPTAKHELLTCISAGWASAKVQSADSPLNSSKPAKGVNIYLADMPDRMTLARVLVFDKPANATICILDDPKLSAYRYVIDSPAIGTWIDKTVNVTAHAEEKH